MRFAAASLLLLALLAPAQAPTTVTAAADAVRLNNLGVASMNQQKFEVALKYFQDASARDQGLTAATVNQAVALLALQRYEPAQQVLEAAVKADDRNVRAWYNLGLLQKGLGNADAALAAFTRATELLPSDPHAHYFVGPDRQPAPAVRQGHPGFHEGPRDRSVPRVGGVRPRARVPAQRQAG